MSDFLFPERLKSLRNLQNKSQKYFAEFLGIPQPSMSAYENGKNKPTIEVLVDIANYLWIGSVVEVVILKTFQI